MSLKDAAERVSAIEQAFHDDASALSASNSDAAMRLTVLTAVGRHGDAFTEAAQGGRAAEVERYLEQGLDVNTKHSELGWTALHMAAANGHEDIVRLLLRHGADQSKISSKKEKTPLELAVQRGHSSIANLLRKGSWGSSSASHEEFVEAGRRGLTDVLRRLLGDGVQVHVTNRYGVSALMFAADQGHVEATRLLLHHGADPKSLTKFGQPLFLSVIDHGHTKIAQLFLDYGAPVQMATDDLVTGLHIAAERGHADLCQLLLRYNADKSARTASGDTPYRVAYRNEMLATQTTSGETLEVLLS